MYLWSLCLSFLNKILLNFYSAIRLHLFSPWLPERFYSSSISFLYELFKWLKDLLSQPSHYYIKISTYLSDCVFFCVLFALIIDKYIAHISLLCKHIHLFLDICGNIKEIYFTFLYIKSTSCRCWPYTVFFAVPFLSGTLQGFER